MCVQTTKSSGAVAGKVAAMRFCRWVYDAATTRRLLVDQIPAPLIVATARGSWTYLVTLRDDGVYLMGHVRQDDSGVEVYEVRPESVGCTCPAATYGRSACKHALALAAALRWLGRDGEGSR